MKNFENPKLENLMLTQHLLLAKVDVHCYAG